jgi:DnaJ-domain-containing protein 1
MMSVGEVSQSQSCLNCGQPLSGDFAPHFCEACRTPQAIRGEADYFQVFHLLPRFGVDRGSLDRLFFSLSRVLHPDRYSLASPDLRQASLDRMSLINTAYQTLLRQDERRVYLLKREGFLKDPSAQEKRSSVASLEWAERWFELQDELDDATSEDASQKITCFLEELEVSEKQIQSEIAANEALYDQSGQRSCLEKLESLLGQSAYFASLKRNATLARARVGA